ncbi:MAG: ATP-dependent Clp protease ATP-binding subunit [Patescibacteria group bacterium]|jgi:ATP-dependent Clp protease ATP-binding subunit ClpC
MSFEKPLESAGDPGVVIDGVFWYWSSVVTPDSMAREEGSQRAKKYVTGLVAVLTILGFLFFALWVGFSDPSILLTKNFWLVPHGQAGLLGVDFLFLCILMYRVKSLKKKIDALPKIRTSPPDVTTIPSLEMIEKSGAIEKVCDKDAQAAIAEAFRFASEAHHQDVTALHLFLGTLTSDDVQVLLMRLGISFEQMKDPIRRKLGELQKGETQFGVLAKTVIARAFRNAVFEHEKTLRAIEIFAASFRSEPFLEELFFSLDVEKEELENAIAWMRINEQLRVRYEVFRKAASFKPTSNMDRAYTAVATPFFNSISEDLTREAVYGKLPLLVGREREMDALLRSIEGGRQSVVLVGDAGTGKDAIIAGLAERMVEELVPHELEDKRLVRLSIPHLVGSGANEAQERFLMALGEVARAGNIILVIDNIGELVGAGGTDLASILASELEKHYTFVIATCTPEGFAAVEKSPLVNSLQKILVEEPERNEAIRILESKIGSIENTHHVIFTYESIAALIDLSIRYLHETRLPVKAIQLAEEVGLMVGKENVEWEKVTKEDVAQLVSEKARVNVTAVTKKEGAQLMNLEERLHERLIGQEEAVKAIAASLRRARTELRAENRPIANFLFLGPTGVGKTELAKATAEIFFGNEEAMIRVDMSEYQQADAMQKLIGASGQTGFLTEAVRKNPFSLVLLDEFEKAHPDLLNLFLQVMDDGRLTDGTGRTIDMTNIILIATSNAGTQYIQDSVVQGLVYEEIRKHLLEEELKTSYRSELLNRFDGVMVFKPLSEDEVVQIAYLLLKKVTARLEAKGIFFRPTDEAVFELAHLGYDPKFGARPLRRVISEKVDDAIANFLLQGKINRRDTLVLKPGGVLEVEKATAL